MSENRVITSKPDKEPRKVIGYRITQYTKPETAAQRIREVFGDALAKAILDETGKTPKQWYEGKVAKSAEPLPQPVVGIGTPGPGRGNKTSNNITGLSPEKRGTSADYTRKRLKRDRPDLLQKVVDGGLSLNQAAVEAGLMQLKTIRPKKEKVELNM